MCSCWWATAAAPLRQLQRLPALLAAAGRGGCGQIRLNVRDQTPEIIQPSAGHGGRSEQGNPPQGVSVGGRILIMPQYTITPEATAIRLPQTQDETKEEG